MRFLAGRYGSRAPMYTWFHFIAITSLWAYYARYKGDGLSWRQSAIFCANHYLFPIQARGIQQNGAFLVRMQYSCSVAFNGRVHYDRLQDGRSRDYPLRTFRSVDQTAREGSDGERWGCRRWFLGSDTV